MKEIAITAAFAISMILAIAFCYSKCMQLQAIEERLALLERKVERRSLPTINIKGKATIYTSGKEVIIADEKSLKR